MAHSPLELNMAFFGAPGAGKTCLVSSFYGYQQTAGFKTERGYGLAASDAKVDTALTHHFNQITSGAWPRSSRVFHNYSFDFVVHPLDSSVAKVNWYDYPGEWWEKTLDPSEAARDAEDFARVLQCDVAFLVIDGQRYTEDGAKYLRTLLPLMKRQFQRHRSLMESNGKPLDRYPRRWVLTLSKSDLMPDGFTARDLHEAITREAAAERDDLARTLLQMVGRPDDEAETFFTTLLLSSLPRQGADAEDRQPFGMELIAPIALAETVEEAIRLAKPGGTGPLIWIASLFSRLLKLLPNFKNRLPPRLQQIVTVLERVRAWEWVDQGVEKLEVARSAAIARKDNLEATYLSMLAELKRPAAQQAYYRPVA